MIEVWGKMRKVELLPTRDGEASYGPVFTFLSTKGDMIKVIELGVRDIDFWVTGKTGVIFLCFTMFRNFKNVIISLQQGLIRSKCNIENEQVVYLMKAKLKMADSFYLIISQKFVAQIYLECKILRGNWWSVLIFWYLCLSSLCHCPITSYIATEGLEQEGISPFLTKRRFCYPK